MEILIDYSNTADHNLTNKKDPEGRPLEKKMNEMKNNYWKESFKFLSGAFFVTAGASWYFSWYHIAVPFLGSEMSPEFLGVRGFIHFGLFLITFYLGFIRKKKTT